MGKTTKNKQPPWRNSDGTKKTDAEISKLGQNWDAKTWKAFLDEDVGKFTNDGRTSHVEDLDELPEVEQETEKNTLANLNLEVIFEIAFEELTPKEQLILSRFFWDGATLRIIAKDLNCSPSSVRTEKERALRHLKKILTDKGFKYKLSLALKKLKATRPKRCPKLNRPKCSTFGGNESLRHETLDFIEENLCHLTHTERKVVECLYFKDMDLQTVASIIKKTVGETSKINKEAGEKLQRIFDEGTAKNKQPTKKAG